MDHVGRGSLENILALNGEDFVQSCYREILHRDADETGLAHHLSVLERGISKVQIAAGLAGSDEAIARGLAETPIAIRARQVALSESKSVPKWIRSNPSLLALAERVHFRRKIARRSGTIDAVQDVVAEAQVQPVEIERLNPSDWTRILKANAVSANNSGGFWFDLTTALQWTGGVVGIVRAELEMASGIKKVHPGVRFSMQVDQGFVEVPEAQISWLLEANNVADAYMKFFDRYPNKQQNGGVLTVNAPDRDGFFHPYSAGDIIFSVGWMDSQKENYFALLKKELPNIYLAYLVYDTILLGPDTRHFYNPIGSQQFERYLKWISHNCDFVLYGGETARKDTEAFQKSKGWPTPPGQAIKFGTDIMKLSDDANSQALLAEVGVDGPFIMTVGSIEPRKNHETLYRAYLLALELSDRPLPQLIICGKPMWRVDDLMDSLARDPRLVGRVICCSPTDSQLAALYKNCEFTLLPSLYEGWSLTLPESLGQGKFCLCADTPPLREIGEDLVDFIEPFDVRAWAETIIKYAGDKALLREREARIASEWPNTKWVDSARMAYDYLVRAKSHHPPQPAKVEGLHDPLDCRSPEIWMDMTLSLLQWNGGVNGIVRAELMYAKFLKKLAPTTRFFAYEDEHFFEVNDSMLTWLIEDGDLSQAYGWFQDFWRHHEEAGTGYRSALRSGGYTPNNPAYLKDFPSNSVIFFAGIDFGEYTSPGVPKMKRIQEIQRHIRPGHNIQLCQLIYDFTPLLLPHVHMAQTVEGYLPFVDYVSNNFDHIIYGGRTAQADGIALQKKHGWRTPLSDFIEFGSNIHSNESLDDVSTDARLLEAESAPASQKDVLAALGITCDFVMTIGTIEPRKNHEMLYKAYLTMQKTGMLEEPLQMVFVGKKGWKSEDFLATLEADERVRGKILMLSPSDDELDTLYRACRFTLLPSFYEGWSLTLPESLSYGKFCLVSDVAPLRETGGDLVEYIHPLDTRGWAERMAFYANNPKEIEARESVIRQNWKAMTWEDSARRLLAILRESHRSSYDRFFSKLQQ